MSLTALAMTTAGAAAKARGNQIAKGKINAATEEERKRQGLLAEESQAELNRSMKHASPAEQAKMLAKANANRFESMRGAMNMDQVASFRNANGVAENVASANRVRIGDANNLAINNARNDARLQAYDDVQLNNNLANARFGENIARTGGFSRGSAGVLGAETNAATRPNGWGDMGDLLTAGGTIAAGRAGAKPA